MRERSNESHSSNNSVVVKTSSKAPQDNADSFVTSSGVSKSEQVSADLSSNASSDDREAQFNRLLAKNNGGAAEPGSANTLMNGGDI